MPPFRKNLSIAEHRAGEYIQYETYTIPDGHHDITDAQIIVTVSNHLPEYIYEYNLHLNGNSIFDENFFDRAISGEWSFGYIFSPEDGDPELSPGDKLSLRLSLLAAQYANISQCIISYNHEGEDSNVKYLKTSDGKKLCKTMGYKPVLFNDPLYFPTEGRTIYIDRDDYDEVMIDHNLFPPVPSVDGKLRILLPQAMLYKPDTFYRVGAYVLYETKEMKDNMVELFVYHFYQRIQSPGSGDPPTDFRYWRELVSINPGINFYEPSGTGYLCIVEQNF